MQPKFKKMLYGGDYNPNQWPKEIWDEDMKLFHQAGINSTTINVFSWAKIQPSENEYDFTELDEIVDTLTKEDVQMVWPQNSMFHALLTSSSVLYLSFSHTRNAFAQFSQYHSPPYSLLMCQQTMFLLSP